MFARQMAVSGAPLAAACLLLMSGRAAAQCGPGGEQPYPQGETTCREVAEGMPAHNAGASAPAPNPNPSPTPTPPGTCSAPPCAALLLGNVGFTTVTGTDARSGVTLHTGEDIFAAFEAGFDTAQESILGELGCNPASLGHIPGGIDTGLAERMLSHQCGITLPREEGNQYISLLDECGGHTRDYHFHERLSCLYKLEGAHSTKVAEAQDGQLIYGKWEDHASQMLPMLDACGGHIGITPDSGGALVYHYHVQDGAPFVIGCFGPGKDDAGNDKLVTLGECRALYSSCGDGDELIITTATSSFSYDPWCPCFDATGSNVGTEELAVFSSSAGVVKCVGSCSSFKPVSEPDPVTSYGGFSVPGLVLAAATAACWIVGSLCCVLHVMARRRNIHGRSSEKRAAHKGSHGSESSDRNSEEAESFTAESFRAESYT